MKKKQVLFVGWVNQGRPPVDGETTKNQYYRSIVRSRFLISIKRRNIRGYTYRQYGRL